MTPAQREEMIVANIGLVKMLANKRKSYSPRRMTFDDLCSYGYKGLIQAVDTFDPSRGYKFSSYAGPCISREITKGIQEWGGNIGKKDSPWVNCESDLSANDSGVCNSLDHLALSREPNPADGVFDDLLESLTPVEKAIVQMRFWDEMLLREIGSKLDRTGALAHLRCRAVIEKLQEKNGVPNGK